MELNTIKKELYKQNPIATLIAVSINGIEYETFLNEVGKVSFSISLNDLGVARFYPEMKAKFLIRWIQIN